GYRTSVAGNRGLLRPQQLVLYLTRESHDMSLELQLVLPDAGGGPEQLGEVQDRYVEGPARVLLGLLLPRVEREVAERARCDDHVGPGVPGLRQRLHGHAQRHVLARQDDGEAAALDLGLV